MKTKTWTVVSNTGKQADLESGLEKREFQKPDLSIASPTVGVGFNLMASEQGSLVLRRYDYASRRLGVPLKHRHSPYRSRNEPSRVRSGHLAH